ncbi:hypothetical protein [Streptomyces sp. NBC_01180]|uniref:hypothetical protein n=1 Tax=Streptomyces sp. NBC_01180 TaxID=2903763 RepID=UPI00386B9027|nr:hypothetical protein OG708_00205 [Streptomyces sp. NBC_01180]WSS53355.1 hypothetical protein OG708_34840 [Streptomyces sp. NBC_01180]
MATDAGITSYHAMVTVGGLKKGMRVGVIGLGGLGYIGARVAVLKGAEVYAADISPRPHGSSPPRSGWRASPSQSPSSPTRICR